MSPPPSSAHLEVLQGPMLGQILPLTAPEIVVGREIPEGLSLSSYREVSRRHARFYLRNSTWCVEDLGSTNGTFVNGARAAPSFSLRDGSLVQLGDFQARFREIGFNSTSVMPGDTQPLPQQLPNSQTATMPVPPATPPSPVMPQPQVVPYPVPMPVSVPVPVLLPVVYPQTPPKNPGLAAVFSFLFAGLGQIYNGEMEKGVPMLLIHLFAWPSAFFCCITSPLFVAAWIWSIIDAYQSAERINRETTGRPY